MRAWYRRGHAHDELRDAVGTGRLEAVDMENLALEWDGICDRIEPGGAHRPDAIRHLNRTTPGSRPRLGPL